MVAIFINEHVTMISASYEIQNGPPSLPQQMSCVTLVTIYYKIS